ncbi:hypothetical protein HYW59_01630 [Candidatus Kaiserbacteria bacterium]|nr:hypothetical protein [Candidatus Kaiserbacteria bacterium]
MTLDALIILAGAFVAVLPFLGFPNSWDTVLLFLAGVCTIGLGIAVRRRLPAGKAGSESQTRKSDTFVENLPSHDSSTHDPV